MLVSSYNVGLLIIWQSLLVHAEPDTSIVTTNNAAHYTNM